MRWLALIFLAAISWLLLQLFREEDERRDCSYVKRGDGVRIEEDLGDAASYPGRAAFFNLP